MNIHFEASDSHISKLRRAATAKYSGSGAPQEVQPEQCTTQPVDSCFLCVICLCVVSDPIECNDCNQLGCSKCFKDWLAKDKSCPNCRAPWNAAKSINRYVKQALYKLEFNCETCSKSFSYENREEHLATCGKVIKCCL